MIIKYGTRDKNIDITDICIDKLCNDNIICIPKEDGKRNEYFDDPYFGVFKSVFIIKGDTVTEYKANIDIMFDISNEYILNPTVNLNPVVNEDDISGNSIPNIICTDEPEVIKVINFETIRRATSIASCNNLNSIHGKINIRGGKIGGKNNVQIPHQNMLVEYLTGNEKVLEVGGNIGRSALILAHILQEKRNNNLVSVECCKEHLHFLRLNKACHNLYFHIEDSALSKKQLIQHTFTREIRISNVLINGYEYVKTIGFADIQKKYKIWFDTLVLDCGNMFYYILQDMPEILDNIKLIIMTNDCSIDEKTYIDISLLNKKFHLLCVEENGTNKNYYEVWKKV